MKKIDTLQAEFRRLALEFPEVTEGSHMHHADFRVRGKIFATLGYPDERHGVVILSRAEQKRFLKLEPAALAPAAGAWGERGATTILLEACSSALLRQLLEMAWSDRAPRRLQIKKQG